MAKFEIRYYLSESAYKLDIIAYKETLNANRSFAINWAQNKLKHSSFKFMI